MIVGFYIKLPAGAVVGIFLLLFKVPELTVKPPLMVSLARKTVPELDLTGFVLFASASIMVLLALHYAGKEDPWNGSVKRLRGHWLVLRRRSDRHLVRSVGKTLGRSSDGPPLHGHQSCGV